MAAPALPTVPNVTSGDPYAGAPLAESPFLEQATTVGAPLLPSSFEQALSQPAPAAAPEPAADPYAGAPLAEDMVAPDPYAGAPVAADIHGYDMDKLAATPLAALLKDKSEFNPVEFYAKNTEALLANPAALEKVEAVFEERDKERMTAGGLAKAVALAPIKAVTSPIETAKTVGKALKGGAEFVGVLAKGVGQVFATGGEVAGHLSAGDLTGAAKGISDAAAAFDTAQQRWVSIVTDKALPAVGVLSRGKTARERLAFDADFKRAEIRAAQGNGELAKALGTDQEGLKASGVTLDPAAIERLSIITDPVNLIPIGGAIGVVGRGGKFLLGKATSPAAAQAFTTGVNAAMEKAIAWPLAKTGAAVEKAGALIETKGPALAKSGAARGYGTIHAAMSGDFAPLAAALAAPTAVKLGGQAIAAAGRGVQAVAPTVGRVASEGVKGAAEGAALAMPLFLGSDEAEREGLLGMVAGAGFIRAGLAGAGVAKQVAETGERAAGRAVQDKLAQKVFETVDRGPIKDSAAYGTDTTLDAAHTQHSATLNNGEQSILSNMREFFRDSGIEIYGLDKNTFVNNVPNVAGASAAEGFFLKRGEKLNPDGTRSPVVQILLNKDTNGLGHELYHAFKSLDPQGSASLEAHISKTWTPEERAWLSDTYNSALNGGKPKNQWTTHLNEKQILEEAAAEVFGRVINATDLSGVRPSITKRASTFAAAALEKMGYPLAGKALPSGPGVSALGVRPGTAEVKVAQDFIADITRRVDDGSLGAAQPGAPLEAGSLGAISRRPDAAPPQAPPKTPAAPATPTPATPPPAPAAPAAAVSVPAAPNIRVTPAEQADFAAQRAQVTNADQAVAAAKDPAQAAHVATLNDSMTAGHAVEIVHKGVIREGGPTPEKPVSRGTRRAEQEAAYVAEAMGEVPESIREPHQKIFFATRYQKGGKQVTARSLDKALANVKNAVDMAVKTETTLPYEVDPATGKLSESGWSEVVQDLKDYWSNQDRGFRGDGQALTPETRTRDIGQSIPPQSPDGPAAILSPERTDFLNLVQGLNIPATTRSSGKIPGNVKGQLLAEMQGRQPQTPAGFTAADVQAKTFKPIEGVGVRSIAEVNPLRNDLRAKGAPVESLIEVTENINLANVESVTPRPDVAGRGGSTDITRAGFSAKPDAKAELARRLEEKRKAGVPITEQVRKQTQQEVDFDARNPRRVRPQETGVFSVKPSEEVRGIAAKAAKASGVADYKPSDRVLEVKEDLAKRIADFYEAAESKPNDPAVQASYAALIDQVEKQGQAILDAGYTIEPFTGKGEPYKSSAEMIADVRDNKHMWFLQTEKEFGRGVDKPVDNPMLQPSKIAPGQVANDVFRWVHDFFGHAKEGYQFGPKGELNAWKSHSEMFSPEAQGALAAETLAQNSWVNYGKHLRDAKGKVAKKGEPGFVPATERPFGEQKNIVIPDEMIAAAKGPEGAAFSVAAASDTKKILDQSPDEWRATVATFKDGLTPEAYRLGLGLKDRADLATLQGLRTQAENLGREQMAAGDFDAAMSTITKAQFFREAIEAAQGTGSAAQGLKLNKEFAGKVPPLSEPTNSFSPARKIADELDPVDMAAIRTEDGEIFTGAWHGEAYVNLLEAAGRGELKTKLPPGFTSLTDLIDSAMSGERPGFVEDGFVTKSGKFLNRADALTHAENINQLKGKAEPGTLAAEGVLESDELAERRSFSPSTAKGKELAKDGYDFFIRGEKGNRTVSVIKDGQQVGYTASRQRNPDFAEVAMTHLQKGERGKGLGEAMYRELFNQLKEDGVKLVEGMAIAPEPIALRNKIFEGQFERLDDPEGRPISVEEALAGLSEMRRPIAVGGKQDRAFPGVEAVNRITPESKFSVRRKAKETKAERLDREETERLAKYNVPAEQKPKGDRPTGWVLPNGKFVGLDTDYHQSWLGENSDSLNKEFGTSFPKDATIDDRMAAINKGFVRAREYNGKMTIELGQKFFKGATKRAIEDLLTKHASDLDSVNLHLLNDQGLVVDQVAQRLFDAENPQAAALEMLERVKSEAKAGREPTAIQRARAMGGEETFSVKPTTEETRTAEARTGAHVTQKKIPGTPEYNAYVQNKIDKGQNFPEAFPVEFRKDKDGNFLAEWDGEPLPIARSYNLLKSHLAEQVGDKDAFASALANKLEREYRAAKDNPEVAEGEFWYSTFREKVGKVLGDDTKLFAELLGATSPQQAVGPNFKDALGAYNQFKSGAYDEMLAKYREGKQKFADGDLAEFTAETGKTGKKATKEAFLGWWQKKHNLIPTKATGKKFGMNSKAVLKVLDRSWLEGVQGPKTPNFTGNLAGTTFKATIDVWAMRLLNRLANEESGNPWRIQSSNETGVTDPQFFFGQEAFQKAADNLGIKADALQAILWFAEKDLWEKKGWTGAAGKAKSDYNTLLDRTVKSPEGQLVFTPEEIQKKKKK